MLDSCSPVFESLGDKLTSALVTSRFFLVQRGLRVCISPVADISIPRETVGIESGGIGLQLKSGDVGVQI